MIGGLVKEAEAVCCVVLCSWVSKSKREAPFYYTSGVSSGKTMSACASQKTTCSVVNRKK